MYEELLTFCLRPFGKDHRPLQPLLEALAGRSAHSPGWSANAPVWALQILRLPHITQHTGLHINSEHLLNANQLLGNQPSFYC